jgi:hypothetical protein
MWGNPFRGQNVSEDPHYGAHVFFDSSGWPATGLQPSDYPPIYAVADGYISAVESDHRGKDADGYRIDLAFAVMNGITLSFAYEMEPSITAPNAADYRQFIIVEEGQSVRKGDVIAYMYMPPEGAPHIHFHISPNANGVDWGLFMAPSIFTEEIVTEFNSKWANGDGQLLEASGKITPEVRGWSQDGDQALPPCMGYMLAQHQNPFGTGEAACLNGYAPPSTSAASAEPTPADFKVALIGDQGLSPHSSAVLQLIKDEGAQMVLHQGDFDYGEDPDAWDQLISDILGPNFPYFASMGNNDRRAWPGYQQKLETRLDVVAGANCTGESAGEPLRLKEPYAETPLSFLGVRSACTYRGLFFILSAVGMTADNQVAYIKKALAENHSIWSICSWHLPMIEMQTGSKRGSVGWAPYRECREAGAIIATAHEHSYSRTKTLISAQEQVVSPEWPDPDVLHVGPGSTFVLVTGLGGKSIRDHERCLPPTYPYGCKGEWAKIYTYDQAAQHGALFITFHVDGDPYKARGYFKTIDGDVVDNFVVYAQPGSR